MDQYPAQQAYEQPEAAPEYSAGQETYGELSWGQDQHAYAGQEASADAQAYPVDQQAYAAQEPVADAQPYAGQEASADAQAYLVDQQAYTAQEAVAGNQAGLVAPDDARPRQVSAYTGVSAAANRRAGITESADSEMDPAPMDFKDYYAWRERTRYADYGLADRTPTGPPNPYDRKVRAIEVYIINESCENIQIGAIWYQRGPGVTKSGHSEIPRGDSRHVVTMEKIGDVLAVCVCMEIIWGSKSHAAQMFVGRQGFWNVHKLYDEQAFLNLPRMEEMCNDTNETYSAATKWPELLVDEVMVKSNPEVWQAYITFRIQAPAPVDPNQPAPPATEPARFGQLDMTADEYQKMLDDV